MTIFFLLLMIVCSPKELRIQYSEENPVLHNYFNGLTD